MRIRSAIKMSGSKKNDRTSKLIGCSIPYFMDHIEKQFNKGMTWENYGKWHIDHRVPCASFDLTDPEQQKACFHYTNMQPMWAKENLKKANKEIYLL